MPQQTQSRQALVAILKGPPSQNYVDQIPHCVTQTFSKNKLNRMFRLGYQLAFQTKSRKKDWKDIYNLWWCAAKGGHKRAQFYLGTCYDHGLGTDKNVGEAF
jgi:uncharacterized protein